MSDEIDISDLCDRFQDQTRELAKLTKAVLSIPAPVVNVAPAAVSAPAVRVDAPNVSVTAPVTVEQIAAHGWEFEVTERDHLGLIKSFTATPI